MAIKPLRLTIFAAFLAMTSPALAAPVADCPLRDASLSVDSPLVDVLLSPAGRAFYSAIGHR